MAKVIGLDRLKRKLAALPKLAEEEISKAMIQSAEEIVAMAKSLAPQDSGDLINSIGWTWGDAPKGAMVLGKVKSSGRGAGNLQITVYAGGGDAFYARFVEFGTSPRVNGGQFAGSSHPGTSAQPFFYPSYRATRKRAKGRVTRAITRSAKRAAAGG
ncbi:HK97-gp10 family putative phage morphogenesis protein [Devosia sp. 2618]|uniref:HK97-gp10 family putative phage morphogenesis protein n=1 Tax=Devosia sp. 2618 TaxID=3156454 RepID=UPI003396397A